MEQWERGTKCRLNIKVVLKTVEPASATYNMLSYRTGILSWTRSIWILPKYPTRPRLFDSTTRKAECEIGLLIYCHWEEFVLETCRDGMCLERKESSKSK